MTFSIVTVALPSDEQVITAARNLLEATKSWKKGKAYEKKAVQTYSQQKGPGDGAAWHCRVSEHTPAEATFDEFWSKLGNSENEKEYVSNASRERSSDDERARNRYINELKKATLVKKISPTQEIWTLYYEFSSFGVSPRVFTVLQVSHYDESSSPRTGCVHPFPSHLINQ